MRPNQVIGYGLMIIGIVATVFFGYLYVHDFILEQATVSEATFHYNPFNQVEVQGVVRNTSELTLKNIWVRATLFDENGNQINSLAAPVQSDRLLPDGTATFFFSVDDPDLQTRDVQVNIDDVQIDLLHW